MKLIEVKHEYSIVCDNKLCDFKIKSENDPYEDSIFYVDKPCPQCGENLLTKEDYITHKKMMDMVKFINRWFGWLAIFQSRKAKKESTFVKSHRGIHITKDRVSE